MRSGFLDTYSRKWVSNTTLHSFSAGIAVVPRVLGIALEVIRAALNFAQQGPGIAVAVGLTALLLPVRSASRAQRERSSSITVLSAQEMLRALYPELTGKNYIMSVTTFGSFDMPWTSMPPFDVEIGPVEMGHMEIVGSGKSSPATERHPVLAAHFEFGRDNILDQVSFRSPEAALEIENDRIRRQVDSHQGWSDKELAEALKQAGAKFGPNQGAELLRVVPLNVLEPFVGSMHIDSTEFRLRHQQKPKSLAEVYWVIAGNADLSDGHAVEWEILCEPFEGKVFSVTRTKKIQ